MFKTPVVQVLRTCTGALSSRTLARSSVNVVGRRAAIGMRARYYSDKAPSADESKKTEEDGEANEADEVEVSPETSLLHKLKAEETKVADCMSRLRYLQADFLNLQRNAAREKEQARDFAISRFASDLLETVDVLSLALKSIPKPAAAPPSESSDSSSPSASESPSASADTHLRDLYDGVESTQRLLLHTLFKHHIKPFDPTGEKFDPNKHEALYQAPIPGKEPGTVLDCQKVGYMIKDRVLRAAQVGVVQDTQS